MDPSSIPIIDLSSDSSSNTSSPIPEPVNGPLPDAPPLKSELPPPNSVEFDPFLDVILNSGRSKSTLQYTLFDRHIVFTLQDGRDSRHRYHRLIGCTKFPAQIFFPEKMFHSLEKIPTWWKGVYISATQWVGRVPHTFLFRIPIAKKSILIQAPRSMTDVAALVSQNRPFSLSLLTQFFVDKQWRRETGRSFILYAEHSLQKVVFRVECLKTRFSIRKVFSYLKNPDDQIKPIDREKVREDLAVVQLFLQKGKECHFSVQRKELEIFQQSEGIVRNYRRLLLDFVRMVRAKMSEMLPNQTMAQSEESSNRPKSQYSGPQVSRAPITIIQESTSTPQVIQILPQPLPEAPGPQMTNPSSKIITISPAPITFVPPRTSLPYAPGPIRVQPHPSIASGTPLTVSSLPCGPDPIRVQPHPSIASGTPLTVSSLPCGTNPIRIQPHSSIATGTPLTVPPSAVTIVPPSTSSHYVSNPIRVQPHPFTASETSMTVSLPNMITISAPTTNHSTSIANPHLASCSSTKSKESNILMNSRPLPDPTSLPEKITCPFCPLTFYFWADSFFVHLGLYHLPPLEEMQTCDMANCGHQIFYRTDHLRHLRSHTTTQSFIPSVKRLGCYLAKFNNYDTVKSYVKLKNNSCPMCQKVIHDQPTLEEHIVLMHLLPDILPHIPPKKSEQTVCACPRLDCQKTFTNILKLVMHMASDHQLTMEFVKFISSDVTDNRCPFEGCDLLFPESDKIRQISKHLEFHAPERVEDTYYQISFILKREKKIVVPTRTEIFLAKLCWAKSLPSSGFKEHCSWRPWNEFPEHRCQMHLCSICVNKEHHAKYFPSHETLLFHYIDEHFKAKLKDEIDRIDVEQDSQGVMRNYITCHECSMQVFRPHFIFHRNLWHEKVLGWIPKHLSYNFKGLPVSEPSQRNHMESKDTSIKPGMSLIRTGQNKPKVKSQPQVNIMTTAFLSFCSNQQLTPAKTNFLHLKTFVEEYLNTTKISGEDLESFVAKLSSELCINVETKELNQLRALQFSQQKAISQPPLILLEESGSGDNSPLVKVSNRLDKEIPFEEWARESFPVLCQKCNIEFKNIQDLLEHLETQGIKTHLHHWLLCKCCQSQFLVRPTMVLNKYLILHTYTRAHLFYQWCDWHKDDFRKRLREKLDTDFLRVCTTSIWNHCELCNESVTDLSSHLMTDFHQTSVQIVNAFVKYCKGRAICPVTTSVKDISLFLELVYQNLTPIRASLTRVWHTLSKVQVEDSKETSLFRDIEDHVKNLSLIKPERKRIFRFFCYACPQEGYSAGNILDHCQSVVHELNISQRHQKGIPAFIQCFPCQGEFSDDLHLRLHVFSPHHLGRNVSKDLVLTEMPNIEEKPMFCYLCRVDVKDKSHFETSLHMDKEHHILSYLEWCKASHTNPVNSTHADIMNYFDKVIRGNVKSLTCMISLETVDSIHEEVRNIRIINQPALIKYAQAVDQFNGTTTNAERLLQTSIEMNPCQSKSKDSQPLSEPPPSPNPKMIKPIKEESSSPNAKRVIPIKKEPPSPIAERIVTVQKPEIPSMTQVVPSRSTICSIVNLDGNQHPYSRVVKSVKEVTTCPKCDQQFGHATHLVLHVVSVHKWSVREFLVDYFAKDVVTCLTCMRKCASHMVFALHHDRHHKYTSCTECKNSFITPSQFYMEDSCGKLDITDEGKAKVKVCLGKYLITDSQEDCDENGSTIIGAKFYKIANEEAGKSQSSSELPSPLIETAHETSSIQKSYVAISQNLRLNAEVALKARGTVKTIDLETRPRSISIGPSSGFKRKEQHVDAVRSSKKIKIKTEPDSETESTIETSNPPISSPLPQQIIDTDLVKVKLGDRGTFICRECQPCEENPCLHLNHSLVVIDSIHDLATHGCKFGHTRFKNVSAFFTKEPKIVLKNLVQDKVMGHVVHKMLP